MLLRLTRKALAIGAIITGALSLWALAQSPFAAPYRDRTSAEIEVALTRALDRSFTTEAASKRIEKALTDGEPDRAVAILRLAEHRQMELDAELIAAVAKADAAASGWNACLACAMDPKDCPDLTRVAACNLPAEMSPVGDVNAVRRALNAWSAGEDIDQFDLSLGLVGLTATAGVVVTAGGSTTVKAGATTLRVARRTGALTPPMTRELGDLARRAVDWDGTGQVLRGAKAPSDLLTPAAGRLIDTAGDLGRLRANTSTADALALMRASDNTTELARITRVAEVSGTHTRGTVEVLGKTRVLRATQRFAELYLATVALLTALAGQLLALALTTIRRWLSAADLQGASR